MALSSLKLLWKKGRVAHFVPGKVRISWANVKGSVLKEHTPYFPAIGKTWRVPHLIGRFSA
jgi:hypothetical protein